MTAEPQLTVIRCPECYQPAPSLTGVFVPWPDKLGELQCWYCKQGVEPLSDILLQVMRFGGDR